MNDLNEHINNDDAGRNRLLNELKEMPGDEQPDHFEQDSKEGLAKLSNEKASRMVDSLNHSLNQHIRKSRKRESKLPGFSFLYISVITVLLLIVIAWLVIRKIG